MYVQSHQTDVTNKYWRHPLLSYMIQTGIHRAFYSDSFDSVAPFLSLFFDLVFFVRVCVFIWCFIYGESEICVCVSFSVLFFPSTLVHSLVSLVRYGAQIESTVRYRDYDAFARHFTTYLFYLPFLSCSSYWLVWCFFLSLHQEYSLSTISIQWYDLRLRFATMWWLRKASSHQTLIPFKYTIAKW